jgi:hypothetical protein
LGEPNRDSVHDYGVEGGSIIVGGDKADNSSNKQGGTFYWAEINVMRHALGPFVVLVPIFLVLGPLGGAPCAICALGAGWPIGVGGAPVGAICALGAAFGARFGKARRVIMFLGADPPFQT